MTPVTKQAWIDALRSGEFNQCTKALGKRYAGLGNSYCCLGVLATIAGASHRIDEDTTTFAGAEGLIFDFGDGAESAGIIPLTCRDTIVSDLNLSQTMVSGPLAREDDLMRILSSRNDCGATFAEIADYLETV